MRRSLFDQWIVRGICRAVTKRRSRNIVRFNLLGPRGITGSELGVDMLQGSEAIRINLFRGHDNKINIAAAWVKIAQGERTDQINAHELAVQESLKLCAKVVKDCTGSKSMRIFVV